VRGTRRVQLICIMMQPIAEEEAEMSSDYNPQSIEMKWQKRWEDENLFKVYIDQGKQKYYLLEMFSLPLGTYPYGPCPQLHHSVMWLPLPKRCGG